MVGPPSQLIKLCFNQIFSERMQFSYFDLFVWFTLDKACLPKTFAV